MRNLLVLFLAMNVVSFIGFAADAPKPPRAARSVHLGFPAPDAALFYNEMVVAESVNGSYFMACGWNTGYFGLQQLGSPTNKVVIFSVWDPTKGDNPNAVKPEDRVELLHEGEGDGVRIRRFGGEGTGGQCMAPFAWKIGELKGFRPDEPIFWSQPDNTLQALFRDNGGSSRLFHSTSTDQGRTWAVPALSNFPNATSKLFSTKTSRGFRILVLNANPKVARRELHLALSEDGKTFTRMALLDVPTPPPVSAPVSRIEKKFRAGIASLQYPHAIEHDGRLLIALSRLKTQTEVFSVSLDDVAALLKK